MEKMKSQTDLMEEMKSQTWLASLPSTIKFIIYTLYTYNCLSMLYMKYRNNLHRYWIYKTMWQNDSNKSNSRMISQYARCSYKQFDSSQNHAHERVTVRNKYNIFVLVFTIHVFHKYDIFNHMPRKTATSRLKQLCHPTKTVISPTRNSYIIPIV
jgi:hypothetical protein